MGCPSHQNHIQYLKGKGRSMHLRNIADYPSNLSGSPVFDVFAIQQHLSSMRRQQSQYGFDQGGLTTAVSSQEADHFSLVYFQGNTVYHILPSVSATQVFKLQFHFHPHLLFNNKYRKKGTPMRAVKIPNGISILANRRAKSSTSSK